jgi:hypothetical protein
MTSRRWTFFTPLIFALVLLGCASHPAKVNCEGKLRPINPAAPAMHSDTTPRED